MAATTRTLLVFSAGDRFQVIQGLLRQAEEAYYRASLEPGADKESLDSAWTRVEQLQAEYKAVEAENAPAEQPSAPTPGA